MDATRYLMVSGRAYMCTKPEPEPELERRSRPRPEYRGRDAWMI